MKGNSYWREPVSTSMIVRGRVSSPSFWDLQTCWCFQQKSQLTRWLLISRWNPMIYLGFHRFSWWHQGPPPSWEVWDFRQFPSLPLHLVGGEHLRWLLQQQLCRSPQRKQRLHGILGALDLPGKKNTFPPQKNARGGGDDFKVIVADICIDSASNPDDLRIVLFVFVCHVLFWVYEECAVWCVPNMLQMLGLTLGSGKLDP